MRLIFKFLLAVALLTCAMGPSPLFAEGKIKITATTSTFASLAREVTGETADIYFVASPNQNIHFITPTPKDVLKTRKADVFIHGGLDLEIWRRPLLNASGRKDFISGERTIDVSEGVNLIEVPEMDHVHSRLEGDVHLFGNPHYWPSPENAKIITATLAKKLSALYPVHASVFQANADRFIAQLEAKIQDWRARMAPYQNWEVVTYHKSWAYFLDFLGLKAAGHLEPKPGIPPTPRHVKAIIADMKEHGVKVIIREVYEENRTPKKAAKETGASVVTLPIEVGQIEGNYIDLIEKNVSELEKVFKK